MNDWENRESKAAKRRTIYEEMRECMRKIKEKVESEETIDSYVSLLTQFIRGRSSLLEMDEFACANIPEEVRAAHEKLFTHLLDGAKVPIGQKAMEEAARRREKAVPNELAITVYLYLMAARYGIEEVHPDSGERILDGIRYHIKGIIEDAVKARLPYLVSPAGSIRLNTATGPAAQKQRHKITMRDMKDGIEMSDGSALWVKFANEEMKQKLRRKFEDKKN
ncbi:hypothetical protein PRIPAC_72380 [Pristionchus pacificus]|uniref:Uncharacterized protein n=1 Tax=Pristionchus pacificus TaxID=54126 RepID=A0A2A6BFK3_PRIPA|nr:hypothetical protein PRIPAC_72380 [Pristionchus pacificus]|eukprot:PDM64646.1 hypothetical protein PRIPAC_52902 [Pristionchus pacificus]